MNKQGDQLLSLRYLRGLAAMMVVIHHTRNPEPWLFNPLADYQAFARGVDIFFVISGLIMYAAARAETPVEFFKKRAIRVVPLYWVSTLLLLLMVVGFKPWLITHAQIEQTFRSILFIPYYSPSNPGKVFTFLIPGWTLNYEMFFYALFCMGLLLKRPLVWISWAIPVLVLAGVFWQPEQAAAKTYTSPIMLEFLGGIWLGWWYCRSGRPAAGWVLGGMLGLTALMMLPPVTDDAAELLYVKVVASVFVVWVALALAGRLPKLSLGTVLGDASYSIYLTHTVLALYVARKLWKHVPLSGAWQFYGWLLLATVSSAGIGVAAYLYIEKPLLARLRNFFLPAKRKQILSVVNE